MPKKSVSKPTGTFVECEGELVFPSAGRDVREAVYHTLSAFRKKDATVRVFLIRNTAMRRLNNEFRGENKPTTVLSFEAGEKFPYPEWGASRKYLGEIYLAPQYIGEKKESVARMVVHGCLHLLGYTHKKKNDRMEMERRERWVLERIEKKNLLSK